MTRAWTKRARSQIRPKVVSDRIQQATFSRAVGKAKKDQATRQEAEPKKLWARFAPQNTHTKFPKIGTEDTRRKNSPNFCITSGDLSHPNVNTEAKVPIIKKRPIQKNSLDKYLKINFILLDFGTLLQILNHFKLAVLLLNVCKLFAFQIIYIR